MPPLPPLPPSLSPSSNVLRTSLALTSTSLSVTIDSPSLSALALDIHKKTVDGTVLWDEGGWHYTSETSQENTALYVLTLDALNFCFWPSDGGKLQYDHLAKALKSLAVSSETSQNPAGDPSGFAFSPSRLAALTPSTLSSLLSPHLPSPLPNLPERTRLLNELGDGLLEFYGGSAVRMIEAAGGSADRLTFLMARTFSGFRDTAVAADG